MSPYFRHEKAVIHPNARIGEGTRVWAFTNITAGAVIGKNCNICDGCYVEKGSLIGNNVTLKNGVYVFEGVELEDDVFCGANVNFTNDRFPRSNRKGPWVLQKTLVKKGATIGVNATILCGLVVGEYAFVGAGSVVTKDVPAHALVFGNPAQFHTYVCRCGQRLNERLECSCRMTYELADHRIRLKE